MDDHSEIFRPIHPPSTLTNLPPGVKKVGHVETSTAYQLVAANSASEVSEDERARRRAQLPPVEKIINLQEFEEMAKRVLGSDSRAFGFYNSRAEDGVGGCPHSCSIA